MRIIICENDIKNMCGRKLFDQHSRYVLEERFVHNDVALITVDRYYKTGTLVDELSIVMSMIDGCSSSFTPSAFVKHINDGSYRFLTLVECLEYEKICHKRNRL